MASMAPNFARRAYHGELATLEPADPAPRPGSPAVVRMLQPMSSSLQRICGGFQRLDLLTALDGAVDRQLADAVPTSLRSRPS